MKRKTTVLIVDDSAVVRQSLSDILSSDPEIEITATAANPYEAARKMNQAIPDVIVLDIEMPRMDGITFLKKIMSQRPIPVVICSSIASEGSEVALKAFDAGAIEIIEKPRFNKRTFFEEAKVQICDTVKAAALVTPKKRSFTRKVEPKLTADVILPISSRSIVPKTANKVIAVGASTGGTEALQVFLGMLPEDTPGTVVVQHMPQYFTAAFAERLDRVCKVCVREAEDGDCIQAGQVLIAPGNSHLILKRTASRYCVQIKDGPLVCRHRPSVDVLFRSSARYAGRNAVGVIMTGMGDDGARGMVEMKEAGSFTIAQDEKTCVVFGMPKEAIARNAVDVVVSLESIADEVLKACNR